MSHANRTRLFAVLVVLIVIPIGLLARSHRAGADPGTLIGFFATYTGVANHVLLCWAVLLSQRQVRFFGSFRVDPDVDA